MCIVQDIKTTQKTSISLCSPRPCLEFSLPRLCLDLSALTSASASTKLPWAHPWWYITGVMAHYSAFRMPLTRFSGDIANHFWSDLKNDFTVEFNGFFYIGEERWNEILEPIFSGFGFSVRGSWYLVGWDRQYAHHTECTLSIGAIFAYSWWKEVPLCRCMNRQTSKTNKISPSSIRHISWSF